MPAGDQSKTGPWYYGWNIVATIMLAGAAANALTYSAFSLFVPEWARDMHVLQSDLMWCVPSMILVSSLLAPKIGTLADRYPAKWLFAGGLCGISLFYGLVSVVQTPLQLTLLYALVCAPTLTLCTAIPANALISRWFVRKRGLALGLSSFGLGVSGLIEPMVVALLLPKIGWQAIWGYGGLLNLLVVVPLAWFVLRQRPTACEGLHYLESDGVADRPQGHGAGGKGNLSWGVVLSSRNFRLMVCIYLCLIGVGGAVGQNLRPYAVHHGFDLKTSGLLLSVVGAGHVVSALVLGMLSDRYGFRKPIIGLCMASMLGALTLAFASGLSAVMFGAVMIGLNSGVFTPMAAAIAEEFGAENFGQAFGRLMMFLPGIMPFAYILARSQEMSGSYTPVLLCYSALLLVAFGLSLMLRPAKHV